MRVPILKIGSILIATVQGALTDTDLETLKGELIERVGRDRAKGVILDVTVLDVVDSFATRMLRTISQSARLRGARTVIVGVQPDVAFAMVELGLDFGDLETALDLEEGLALLKDTEKAEGGDGR